MGTPPGKYDRSAGLALNPPGGSIGKVGWVDVSVCEQPMVRKGVWVSVSVCEQPMVGKVGECVWTSPGKGRRECGG